MNVHISIPELDERNLTTEEFFRVVYVMLVHEIKYLSEIHPSEAINNVEDYPLRYQISMSDADNVPPKWADTDEDGYPILCYSSKFLLRMTDADLLHYCWHVFEMVSKTGFVNLVNKESESGVMERVIGLRGKQKLLSAASRKAMEEANIRLYWLLSETSFLYIVS